MSFWQYCEQVAKGVGVNSMVNNIKIVHQCWNNSETTDDAIIALNKADRNQSLTALLNRPLNLI